MDYKKIVPSRSLRLKILRMLSFVPDSIMIRLQYYIKTGRRLNLKNPKRFTEKLQWYKLYYKNPTMIRCVDKYDVREYVKEKGLESILIPYYGVYDSVDEIQWEALPNRFVLKDTLAGGGTSVILVNDKKQADLNELKKMCQTWLSTPSKRKEGGREWPYYSGKRRRILVEELLDSADEYGLCDYKFFCFNGKVSFLYVVTEREMGKSASLGIYDADFNSLPARRCDEKPLQRIVDKPVNFERMKECAEILAKDFPQARIDLYSHDGKVLFGEITFFDGSGYMKFEPDEFDFKFGEPFTLEKYDAPKGKEVTYESCLSVTRKETESPRRSTGTERLTVEK